MRRKDRELSGREELVEILRACRVCRVAMADGDRPYVVPMNFGLELEQDQLVIYLHCAKEGRKLEILKKNPKVCIEADCGHRLVEGETACSYGYTFSSVIGEGEAELLEDPERKIRGLQALMRHQTGKSFSFTPAQAAAVEVIRVPLQHVSGKRRAG